MSEEALTSNLFVLQAYTAVYKNILYRRRRFWSLDSARALASLPALTPSYNPHLKQQPLQHDARQRQTLDGERKGRPRVTAAMAGSPFAVGKARARAVPRTPTTATTFFIARVIVSSCFLGVQMLSTSGCGS